MRVAVLDDYQKAAHRFADWDALQGEVTFLHDHIADTATLTETLRGYDVVVAMRERTPFTEDRFALLPDLRLLVTTGMANASIDLEAATRHGVTVCGTGGSAHATPELTWGLILALVRSIPSEDAGIREGSWQRTIGGDLHGRTLGVVGLGHLGTRVAAIGRAFGMRVLAWSTNLDADTARAAGVEPVSKRELFESSDIVTVHYKLSDRSIGLVGRHELAWMREHAYLVNTSRGPLLDSAALVEALHEGRIAGAGLDVHDVEPLPADHPLRTTPRTILTPHLGYVTEATYEVFYQQAVEDIAAHRAGKPVRLLTP
ncbi:D-2-hydroxyacid dehydrogenase family protein [Streptomyces tsukubensis]|uniref:Hydroxyacid dehydrogenase n=1 Tax=Streptomyces tsukubensis TaxID=83656 RepID=A0A1V4AGB9_9ACTN|nr:D-2-hydroxyacid dehydrogenase family protein [Streptomyces tsukubensis]OON82705.1 hydroxyacid dehydrogenase [Streptomyces tsukubensis]QFR92122.1 D-2-hydroxyacid dehydrogenase family protein [Streptomyces tsukubensis]